MARETAFGTRYLPLEVYEDKDGVPHPRGDAPALPAAAATAAGAAKSSKKSAPLSGDDAALVEAFVAIGLAEQRAQDTLRNPKLAADLTMLIEKASPAAITKTEGLLLYETATKMQTNPWLHPYIDHIVNVIMAKKVTTKNQLSAGFDFLQGLLGSMNLDGFDDAAGVGVVVTPDQIKKAVAEVIAKHKDALVTDRYRFNVGPLLGDIRNTLKWADSKAVKDEMDAQVKALLGPRTEEDNKKPDKKKGKAGADGSKKKGDKKKEAEAAVDEPLVTFAGAAAHFHKPGHNYETDGYVVTPNTEALLKKHLQETGGRVFTRFPPEPNGILHIGHAKAINFNFSYARLNNGLCNLRYDDTNPEAEDEEFFVGIRRDVEWLLGPEPWAKITHSSDYFQQLYEWAIVLIKKDLAYICHQQSDELKGHESRTFSPWRNRPIEESLSLFEDMKNGLIDEGKATLRLKHVMEDGKIDPVAYRIKFHEHARTGDKWCIYPTYDYTHCLCDSIENISHSLCTKEFQNRRSSYYWLCNALDIYCPVQWEYSRLNFSYALVSKRKIGKLIAAGIVRGWDDPRLFTLAALRRRGFPPQAINEFCSNVGVTGSLTTMAPEMLEAVVRDHLNKTSPRVMAVLDPLKVTIVDLPAGTTSATAAVNPVDESMGERQVPISKTIYIEKSDFLKDGEAGYRRLTLQQPVGLKYASLVISVKEVKEEHGEVVELVVSATPLEEAKKPKAFIHWVSSPAGKAPRKAEVRVHKRLFKHPNPESQPGGFLADVADESETIYPEALVDCGAEGAKVADVFQFERVGYFCVDTDTTDDHLVFNQTIALREDSSKKN
eukprot:m.33162 g.33162  ORF g.33162 m.33162 type:complete len:831 (+) comp5596_c0_seq2:33-2525(+)